MLDAETAIITKLTAAIAAMNPAMNPAPRVCSSATLAGTADVAALCPLVVVHPTRSTKAERTPDDLLYEMQAWTILVTIKNIPDASQLSKNYQAASALLTTIVRALSGWEPEASTFNAMKYVGRLETAVSQLGFTEFPLEFETRYSLNLIPVAPTTVAFTTANITHDIKPPANSGEPVAVDNVTLPQ